MDTNSNLVVRHVAEPTPRLACFDPVSIALHWLTVLLVLSQLATAWLMHQGVGDSAAVLTLHRSVGAMTWFVVAGRLVWRARFADLPPFPASMPKLQQWAAKLNEYGLYALLLIQPLTGLGDALFHGRPFTLFAWQVPALLQPNKGLSHLFGGIHEMGAVALLALIGLHIGAALLHGLVLRDGILSRMAPWPQRSRS